MEEGSMGLEEQLSDAAMKGDVGLLLGIMAQDKYILVKVLLGCHKGKNPLHLATSTKQEAFVKKLLELEPRLAELVDKELGAALHLASANGDLRIVEGLLEVSPEMCMARDQDGFNPLHIAAMKGKLNVLDKLFETCPIAARVTVGRGETILHLCVKYNQVQSLRQLAGMIGDPKFIGSKDADGNTILHIAVFCKRAEIVDYALHHTDIKVTN